MLLLVEVKLVQVPPLGPALGPLGINILQVVNTINEKTKDFPGMKVPVKVEVDSDTKKFTVEVGTAYIGEPERPSYTIAKSGITAAWRAT